MDNLFNLPFMKKPPSKPEEPAASAKPSPEAQENEKKLKLYRLIIERYRDKIEQYETKSVSELKMLVAPYDEKIASVKNAITENFHPYIYEENFLEAAKSAFAYLSSFQTISSPVSFWLSFGEMEEIMAGDEIDKSIFLCSILRALGSENAKVFVTESKNAYVLFQFGGKSFVADHSKDNLQEFDSGEAAMSSLRGRILYAFNDKEYEDFREG
ncbi:MAG: hypothetical protein N3G22_03390 [Candidatus Micrarchaeota archaeon]|nr:hypothetical protein [Candidatus Micrarchaeota archaeon]